MTFHAILFDALLILAGLGGLIITGTALIVFHDCRIIYQGKLKEVCPYKKDTCPYKLEGKCSSNAPWNTEVPPHE